MFSWFHCSSLLAHSCSLIGQTYLSLSNHHSLSGLVASWANPVVRNFSLFISVVVFVPLHGEIIPLFCFLFLIFFFYLPSHFFSFFFYFFGLFLTTASWNRSGWHPRSLTGQCTSHLPPSCFLFISFTPSFTCSPSFYSSPAPLFTPTKISLHLIQVSALIDFLLPLHL